MGCGASCLDDGVCQRRKTEVCSVCIISFSEDVHVLAGGGHISMATMFLPGETEERTPAPLKLCLI